VQQPSAELAGSFGRRVLPRADRREIPAIFAGGALGTGLCGGLSTFSTMQVEILKMLDARAWGLAAGYAAASVAAGYAAIHLATAMVRRVRVRQ